jgi:F0F1-type ATP synthase assembly protein I
MKKDKFYRFVRNYNVIMSNIWLLITTLLAGAVIGYFVNKKFPTDKNIWFIVIMIIFFIIGIANFFYLIYTKSKDFDKIEAGKKNV